MCCIKQHDVHGLSTRVDPRRTNSDAFLIQAFHDKVVPMAKFNKPIAFFLFVIFMTNLGLLSLAKNKLSHDIMHAGLAGLSVDHHHGFDGDDEAADDTDLGVMPHQALHAADHVQFIYLALPVTLAAAAEAGTVTLHFAALMLPRPSVDLPFRPPRQFPLA